MLHPRRACRAHVRALILVPLLAIAALPSALLAQYFGRQKVQYETFDFRVMSTEHIDVHFYPPAEEAIRDAARMSERWYARLSSMLRHELPRQPVVYYANHPDFQQTNVIGGLIDQGTGGVTEGLRNRVVLPLTGIYHTTDHVIGHELVHAFQYDIARQPEAGGLQGIGTLPLWLVEGMAEYLAIGRIDPHTAMWLRDAAIRSDLPSIEQLTKDPRYFPYRYGQALWAYIGGRWGDEVIPTLYRAAAQIGFEQALVTVLGMGSDTLSAQWIEAIDATYDPLIAGRTLPADVGRRVIGDPSEPGDMNISPVVSPDGRYVAFFGRRDLFTVDLYLADARTGEVIRELASPQTDAHVDAISFLYSAGTWSPDGRRLAFVVFAEGDNQIAVLDVASGNVERRYSVRDVGAISDPAWSPDGTRIAFSGNEGGLSDLYVLDLASEQVRRLTSDKHADIHPAWSPDSRTIAIATDRGESTSFDRLVYSPMRLALVDATSGAVRVLPGFPDAKHINPRYSADGGDLYFISDRGGVSDIYRMSVATGEMFQVTNVATGITGISELSPAMSISNDGQLWFSVFQNAGQTIHALAAADARGTAVAELPAGIPIASVLPPAEAVRRSAVTEYLADASFGLPATDDFPVAPYEPGLSLNFVGGPAIGAGVNEFGTTFGGGVTFWFSDMLGNRNVGATLQASGGLKDIGGQVVYQNMRRRWNWGVGAAHIPYLTGFTGIRPGPTVDGQQTVQYFTRFQRIFIDELSAMTHYPFSTTRRFELSLGATRLGFDEEEESITVLGGFIVDRSLTDVPAPDALYYGQGSAALVGDNSFVAFTSPISGGRYRFEGSPTVGALTFVTALADWRRYFFANPFTFAVRAMHYGRYGRDAEDQRLSPLYLGYESLVRGYAIENFDLSECTDVPDSEACPEFDRLIGSRIAVASAEFRIPLFGTEQFGLFDFPYLPTELAPFVDAGVAWFSGQSPELRFERESIERIPVVSAGVSARMNILGYLVFEAYWAYPFQRPEAGGHFGFALQPGW